MAKSDGFRYCLVTGSSDKSAQVWDALSGEPLVRLDGHEGGVTCVAYSSNDRLIASGSTDGSVRVWDARTGAQLARLDGFGCTVESVAFSPGGRFVAGGGGKSVRVWHAETGELLSWLDDQGDRVASGTQSPDRRWFDRGRRRTVTIREGAFGGQGARLGLHAAGATGLAYSPDGRLIARKSQDGSVQAWDTSTGACLEVIWDDSYTSKMTTDKHTYQLVAVSRAGETAIVSDRDGREVAWFGPVEQLCTCIAGRTWAGVLSEYLAMFCLEGDPGPA
jgi:YD repeat-containing protein